MSEDNRKSIFEKLFGPGEAAKARQDLRDAQKLLDQMGLERKEDEGKQEGAVALVDQVLQGVLESMAAEGVIDAAIAAESAPNVNSEDDFMQMVASAAMNVIEAANHAMSTGDMPDKPEEDASPEDAPPEDSAEEPPPDEEDMASEEDKGAMHRRAGRRRRRELDAAAANENEDTDMQEQELEQIKALETRLDELTDTMAKSIEDQGELAKAILAVTEIAPVVKALQEDVTGIKEAMALVPRQASKDVDTLFEDETIKKELLKSINSETNKFLGMPLSG